MLQRIRRAVKRCWPPATLRAAGLAVLCAVISGCVSAPQPRPVHELLEEARAAARMTENAPLRDGRIRQPSGAARRQPVVPGPKEPGRGPVQHSSHEAPLPSAAQSDHDPAEFVMPQLPPQGAQLLNETFLESDVREALQILASQAKVSVIIDEQVSGVTSAVIENEPFEAALQKVLLPLGLVYRKDGDQHLVGVPDPASALFSRIAERYDYRAMHLAPSELMQLLPEHLKRFVRTSEKRNLIIVEAPPQIAANILQDLSRSDQPVGQVVLEAFVCVISPESGLQFGFDLEQGFPVSGGSVVNLALASLNVAGDYATPGLPSFAFTSAFLKALASEGYVSIRAAPRVMAKDGETARITIARETFFSVQPGATQVLFRQDIEKIEAGISLDITPVIRGNQITVQIERAEVSEGIDNPALVEGQSNTFPIINRRRVSTTVHVLDGETITIGGLVQRQQVARVNKVPFFGDIPLVGTMFQRIDRREEEAEVVIFISPRIVREEIRWPEP